MVWGHAVIWWSVRLLCKGFNYFLHLSAQEHHASGKILRRLKALKKAHLNKGGLTWHCSYLILYCPAMWLRGYWGAAFLLPGAQTVLFLSSSRIGGFVEHTMGKKQGQRTFYSKASTHNNIPEVQWQAHRLKNESKAIPTVSFWTFTRIKENYALKVSYSKLARSVWTYLEQLISFLFDLYLSS